MSDSLRAARQSAFDDALAGYDFGRDGYAFVAHGHMLSRDGDSWEKSVYVRPDDAPDADSETHGFHVDFAPGSAVVVAALFNCA